MAARDEDMHLDNDDDEANDDDEIADQVLLGAVHDRICQTHDLGRFMEYAEAKFAMEPEWLRTDVTVALCVAASYHGHRPLVRAVNAARAKDAQVLPGAHAAVAGLDAAADDPAPDALDFELTSAIEQQEFIHVTFLVARFASQAVYAAHAGDRFQTLLGDVDAALEHKYRDQWRMHDQHALMVHPDVPLPEDPSLDLAVFAGPVLMRRALESAAAATTLAHNSSGAKRPPAPDWQPTSRVTRHRPEALQSAAS